MWHKIVKQKKLSQKLVGWYDHCNWTLVLEDAEFSGRLSCLLLQIWINASVYVSSCSIYYIFIFRGHHDNNHVTNILITSIRIFPWNVSQYLPYNKRFLPTFLNTETQFFLNLHEVISQYTHHKWKVSLS